MSGDTAAGGTSSLNDTRQTIGVVILALSVVYSLIDLAGWLRPWFLEWRLQGGVERTGAIVLGSLFFKAVILFTGALLAFWPRRRQR